MKSWEKNKENKNFNEFYTLYEECEKIFRPIIDQLQNKHIHCPCDDENSNIVKWLKENTSSYITYSGLPDIDMNSEKAKELMLKADMVITNPPFSMKYWKPFFIWLNDIYVKQYNKDYFIFGPVNSSASWYDSKSKLFEKVIYIYSLEGSRFLVRPYATKEDGLKCAGTMWYTSLKCKPLSLKYKPSKKPQEYYENIPVYNRSEHVPPEYDDWMYVPCTYLRFIDLGAYEIDYDDKGVPEKYIRLKIRKK